jgi:rubrerythrin
MFIYVHRWIWSDAGRRAEKLLRFSETEIDGGRDILRAAELTPDPLLRRLYLLHASDENRHGQLFRRQASEIFRSSSPAGVDPFHWVAPAGHGLDDLRVDEESDVTMLAFLHVAEKDAAGRFQIYRDVLHNDPSTRAIFEDILHDEKFHMNYTLSQLVRVSPQKHRWQLWRARMSRLWKSYLRLASAIGNVLGSVILTVQYFVVLPLFAFLAKRTHARERRGWHSIPPDRNSSLTSQY